MKTIEEYAVTLVADGAESLAEDDMNEEGAIAEDDHPAACKLALEITRAIRANPHAVLALVEQHKPVVDADADPGGMGVVADTISAVRNELDEALSDDMRMTSEDSPGLEDVLANVRLLAHLYDGAREAIEAQEEEHGRALIATRQMFNDTHARLRAQLLAALAVEDDGKTGLGEYIDRLVADRDRHQIAAEQNQSELRLLKGIVAAEGVCQDRLSADDVTHYASFITGHPDVPLSEQHLAAARAILGAVVGDGRLLKAERAKPAR